MADIRLSKPKNRNQDQQSDQRQSLPERAAKPITTTKVVMPDAEVSRSLLSRAGSGALSGIHTVGSVSSALSRNLWGSLNGMAGLEGGYGNRSLMDSTGGVELSHVLGNLGVLPKNDPNKWEWMDPVRGAVDIVGDPFSWMLPGGLTKAGQLAAKTVKGVTPGIAASIKAGERGLLSFHHPLSINSLGAIGTGENVGKAVEYAGKKTGASWALKKAAESPPALWAKKHFATSAMGRSTAPTQEMARQIHPAEIAAKERQALEGVHAISQVQLAGLGNDKYDKALRAMGETGMRNADPTGALNRLHPMKQSLHAEAKSLGIPTSDLKPQWTKAMERHGNAKSAQEYILDKQGNVLHVNENMAPRGGFAALQTGDYAQRIDSSGKHAFSIPKPVLGVTSQNGIPYAKLHGESQLVPLNELRSATILRPALAANEHIPRQLAAGVKYGGGSAVNPKNAVSVSSAMDTSRDPVFIGLKGGTASLNDALKDVSNSVTASGKPVLETLRQNLTPEQAARAAGKLIEKKIGIGRLEKKYVASSRLQNRAKNLGDIAVQNPQLAEAGLFTNSTLGDYTRYNTSLASRNERAKGLRDFLASQARPSTLPREATTVSPIVNESLDTLDQFGRHKGVTLKEAMGGLGLKSKQAANGIYSQLPQHVQTHVHTLAMDRAKKSAEHAIMQRKGEYESAIRQLASRPMDADELRHLDHLQSKYEKFMGDLDSHAANLTQKHYARELPKEILKMNVPAKEYNSLVGTLDYGHKETPSNLWRDASNVWKANVLAHPATQVRNALSAAANNQLKEHSTLRSGHNMQSLLRGGEVSGIKANNPALREMMAAEGISETEAMRRYHAAYFPESQNITNDLPADQLGTQFKDISQNISREKVPLSDIITKPLAALAGYDQGKHVGWNALNPFAQKNTFGHKATQYAPSMMSNMVANTTEKYNRGAGFMGLMEQGYDPAVAAHKATKAQVDYSDFTPTEQMLKGYIPFYGFNRKMAENVVRDIANPGSRLSHLVKSEDRAHAQDPSLPDSVLAGTALPYPFGNTNDGTKRFVTGLGLMHEPAIHTLGSLAGWNLRGAGYDVLGMMHPVPKTILENTTGQSFYQRGEPQANLDPNVGRTLSNLGVMAGLRDKEAGPVQYPGSGLVETALSMSPFSRLASTARALTDQRKTLGEKLLNTTTGARITDVSPNKQAYTLMRRAEDLAKASGARSRQDVYFSKDQLAKLKESDPVQYQRQVELQKLLNALKAKKPSKPKGDGSSKPKSTKPKKIRLEKAR